MLDAWYIRYYRERFLEDYQPFSEVDTRDQVDYVESALGLSPAARILDLACGWGRHSRLLAERGHEVVGSDLSQAFLRSGRAIAESPVRWVCGDMRWLPFPSYHFDAAICLWNSYGYFDDEGNRQVVQELSRVLAPEGRVVLDIPNRDFLIGRGVLGQDWMQEGESYVLRSRQLDPLTSVLHNQTVILGSDGGTRQYDMLIRCYTFPEFRQLLAEGGLVTEGVCGAYDPAHELSLDSYQMVVLARKGG